jgi:hypothetical protein
MVLPKIIRKSLKPYETMYLSGEKAKKSETDSFAKRQAKEMMILISKIRNTIREIFKKKKMKETRF